jgi:hypothetical protein
MQYLIINKQNMSIFSEPTRPSWKDSSYASEGAAKAGITRTMKFYQKAIKDVASVVADGKPEYHSSLYNAFRDATDSALGRTHLAQRDNFVIMTADEYSMVEPMVERTNMMSGKKFMESINTPGYMSPASESYWSM